MPLFIKNELHSGGDIDQEEEIKTLGENCCLLAAFSLPLTYYVALVESPHAPFNMGHSSIEVQILKT